MIAIPQIRPLQPTEIPLLVELARSTFEENYAHLNDPANFQAYVAAAFSPEQWLLEYLDPDARLFMAWQHDQPVGYIKVNLDRPRTELPAAHQAELERIYVHSRAQRAGIGRLLLEQAKEVARAAGAAQLWLGVWEKNPRAIAWYQKQGFVQFGSHTFQLGWEPQNDLLMQLVL